MVSLELFRLSGGVRLLGRARSRPQHVHGACRGSSHGCQADHAPVARRRFGFVLLTASIGFRMVGVQTASPSAYGIAQAIGVASVILVGWRIAIRRPPGRPDLQNVETTATQLPLTVLQASAVQISMPSSWVVVITAMTLYAAVRSIAGAVVVALAIAIGGTLGSAVWIISRIGLRKLLWRPKHLNAIWLAAGVALIVSTVTPAGSLR